MSTLIIDCGSYSVKFLEGNFQRKAFKIENVDEVLIEDVRNPNDLNTTLEEYQQRIIQQYLQQSHFTGKTISQIPSDFITTRYLDLPISNKKKAQLMIPFQLDEDLPFATKDTHYINTFHKNANGNYSSIVQITEDKVFNEYQGYLKDCHTLPSILTSDLSVYQSYIEDRKFGGHVCIIDIGHTKTKAYFAFNDTILSNHTSSVAGKSIDEVIAKTYDISNDDARIYKHENSFFLTEGQLEQVSANQKDFAILMRQTFSPLIQQIQTWLLGYRIKTGFSVEKIFVTGGSANTKNIENFLTEKLEIPVELFKIMSLDSQVSKEESNSLFLPFLMAQSQKYKSPPQNFLTKGYASGLNNGIKMEDTSFSLYRMAIICLIIGIGTLIETQLFMKKELKLNNRSVTKMLKKNELNLTKKQIRLYKRKPKKISSVLKAKHNVILADIKTIEKKRESTAIKNLAFLSREIKQNERVSLIDFKSNGTTTTAIFTGETKRDISQFKELIKSLNIIDLEIKTLNKNKKLQISFSGY